MSVFFKTKRGVRQGCILSPLLFLIVVELLAIKIRNGKEIIGILDNSKNIFTEEVKCIQYADDMSLMLANIESLSRALKLIDDFRLLTGLSLNRKKSVAMTIGNFIKGGESPEDLIWLKPEDNIKILGVLFN